MESMNITQEIASLPLEAQKQVMDLVALLKSQYSSASVEDKPACTKISDEPFIGMWKDRDDMRDSTAWVRELRQSEWDS